MEGKQISMEVAGMPVQIKNGVTVFIDAEVCAPIFNVGDVIDIRPSANGLPDRIYIIDRILKVTKGDMGWVYQVGFESDESIKNLPEDFITEKMINKHRKVYQLEVIKARYEAGWRFVGNHKLYTAREMGAKYAQYTNVKHVRICESYNPNGGLDTNTVSVWIMYNNPIKATNGTVDKIDIMLK